MSAFPEAPPNLKTIQPYLKIAIEHDERDVVGELTKNSELKFCFVLKFIEFRKVGDYLLKAQLQYVFPVSDNSFKLS
jgi:hypothetical protein